MFFFVILNLTAVIAYKSGMVWYGIITIILLETEKFHNSHFTEPSVSKDLEDIPV